MKRRSISIQLSVSGDGNQDSFRLKLPNLRVLCAAMSSRGGSYKRGGKQYQFQRRQKDDDFMVKPIQELNQVAEANNFRSSSLPESSDSTVTTSAAEAATSTNLSMSNNQGEFRNHRNSRWHPRNRRTDMGQPRFFDKTEVGSSGVGEKNDEKQEQLTDGEGLELEKTRSSDEVYVGNDVVKKEDEVGVDEAQKILEELILSSDGPELVEEQLLVNDQRQEDELLAMESIYGNNILMLERIRSLRAFQIYVHIETPTEVTVSAELNSSGVLEKQNDESPEFLYSFEVKYLPPIVLTCALPKLYPSHSPPYFTIFAQWLNAANISKLCHMLDSIWNEQSEQEIIYQWAEWLQSSCLSFLGFDEGITLGPYGVKFDRDKRALSGSVSADVDIPSMKSYNDEKILGNFRKDFHQCCICFSEFAGTEFVRLPCLHFFCWNCMRTYSDIHVKEGTVTKLQCPDAKCDSMIPPGLLRRLLSEEEFERWESMTLQKTLESMSDVTYCPRCETACIEDEDEHALCSKCFFSFCTLCRERRHVGVACMTPEMKLHVLQERQKSCQLGVDQKRRVQDMINEQLNLKVINRTSKKCPSCKMAISRTEGCNKMVCLNCGQYFCYRCEQAINGYDHFRDGKCELFPPEAVQAWENQMNGRQVIGQILAEMYENRGHECPNCRQLNVKANNNNHIFCWACQNHYCYLCRKMVRRGTLHFGPKGCKQHTTG